MLLAFSSCKQDAASAADKSALPFTGSNECGKSTTGDRPSKQSLQQLVKDANQPSMPFPFVGFAMLISICNTLMQSASAGEMTQQHQTKTSTIAIAILR